MPNYETKPKRHEGNGPPWPDLGFIGDRYTDKKTGEIYTKRKTGWTNRGRLEVHPTMRQKGAWVKAARNAGQNLESWVCATLDKATIPTPNPKPSDAS